MKFIPSLEGEDLATLAEGMEYRFDVANDRGLEEPERYNREGPPTRQPGIDRLKSRDGM